MSDRSIVAAGEPENHRSWLNEYMPANQVAVHQSQPRFIDMAMIRGVLFRQRWLILAVIASALLIGVAVTMLATPMYEARSSVRVDPYGADIVEGQDVDRGIASNQVGNFLQTQIGVIESRRLARVVAEDLNLADRMDFLGQVDANRPPNMSDEDWHEARTNMAAQMLQGSVDAELVPGNWIITIAYRSQDPALAAEMANAYSAAFAAMETRDSTEDNLYAQEYLREQIQMTRERLQEAEQAANAFARSNGIIVQQSSDEEGGNVTLTATNLASINAQVTQAQAARISAEQRWRAIQNLPAEQLSEFQNNSLLSGLIDQRTSKQAELVDLRQRFLDGHPQVVSAREQIETLDAQINRTAADIKSAIRNEYIVASNEEQALRAALSSATSETLTEQDQQVEYGVLEREADALRDQLQALLRRFNEISSASNIQDGQITQLDSALLPRAPYSPNMFANLLLSLVGGVGLAAALVLVREMFDEKIRSFDDVETAIGVRLLGHTPYVDHDESDIDNANSFDPLMEAYASIRTTIEFMLAREQTVIQVTSTQASEGKSTTSIALAAQFASIGKRVLLVDGDLRLPSLSGLLEVERPKAGLVDVLLGEAELSSAVIQRETGFDILPIRKVPGNPTEILASHQFREFVAECRSRYSMVIIDSAPVLGLADALTLGRIVDGTVFVIEANRTTGAKARNAIRRLQSNGGNPLGAVLTKYKAMEAGEGYGEQYSYYSYGGDKAKA